MSDVPNNSFMDEVVEPEDVRLIENLHVDEFYQSSEEDFNCSDASDSDASDSDASSLPSIDAMEILAPISAVDIRDLVSQLRRIAVHQACREIFNVEQSLKACQKILEERNMRHVFRDITNALKTSLADLDTTIMKKLKILRLNAADRIAVRPIFHRAGYHVQSPDPMVTRAGLPRAVSMPDGLPALEDIGSISSLCEEYPEFVIPGTL